MIREVAEESGLTAIEVETFIAEDRWPHPEKPKAYHRYFYRVTPSEEFPDAWTHEVTGNGEDEGMEYAYHWTDPHSISLARDMDDYVDRL